MSDATFRVVRLADVIAELERESARRHRDFKLQLELEEITDAASVAARMAIIESEGLGR